MGIPTARRVVHPPKLLRRRVAVGLITETPPADQVEDAPAVEPRDGWYRLAQDGRQQFGSFETCEEIRADRDQGSEHGFDERQAPDQAEEVFRSAESVEAVHESPVQPMGSTSEE